MKQRIGSVIKGSCLKRTYILLFMFLFIHYKGSGQGFYKIHYQMYNTVNNIKTFYGPIYESLLLDYGSKESLMRVRYFWNGDTTLVEQKVSSYIENSTDPSGNEVSNWIFRGYDVRFIKKGNASGYYPDVIVLKRNPYDKYYYPDYVYSKYDNKTEYGDIKSFEVIEKQNITNDFLSRFEWKWAEKKTEFDVANTTLYLILVSSTRDVELSSGFIQNHNKIYALFSESAEVAGIKFIPIEIKDDNFNKEFISLKIRNLSVGSKDIIIFYYSGHGFRYFNQSPESNPWPQLALTYKRGVDISQYTYNLVDIYKALVNKGGRLTLVFGECCNTGNGFSTPIISDYPKFAPGGIPFKKESLQKLFTSRGSLLLSTSRPHEYSMYYPNSGGYFCTSFYKAFMQKTAAFYSNEVSWKDIIDAAINNTAKISQEDQDTENSQRPQMHFDIK